MREHKLEIGDYVRTKEDVMEEAIPPRSIPKHTPGMILDFATADNGTKGCFVELGQEFDEDNPIAGLALDQIELIMTFSENCAFYVLEHEEMQTYEQVKEHYTNDADEVWEAFQKFKSEGITEETFLNKK